MPELAEVEWFRKQWDAGRGGEIVDLGLHARNRVFRGSDVGKLRQRLIGERLLGSYARGKRMLFKFSGGVWLGFNLALPGRSGASSRINARPSTAIPFWLHAKARSASPTPAQSARARFNLG